MRADSETVRKRVRLTRGRCILYGAENQDKSWTVFDERGKRITTHLTFEGAKGGAFTYARRFEKLCPKMSKKQSTWETVFNEMMVRE